MPEIDLDAVPRPALTAAVRAALALADALEQWQEAADHRASVLAHNDYDAGMVTAYEAAIDGLAAVTAALAAGGAE